VLSIQKQKDVSGEIRWSAFIRVPGRPAICKSFSNKELSINWGQQAEKEIKDGSYHFPSCDKKSTLSDLIDRYLADGILDHYRAPLEVARRLTYWKEVLGDFELKSITSERLRQEQEKLCNTISTRAAPFAPSTVNHYFSVLNALFIYGEASLGWVTTNPCVKVRRLKRRYRPRKKKPVVVAKGSTSSNDIMIPVLERLRQEKDKIERKICVVESIIEDL
jgi:hypothetical protein